MQLNWLYFCGMWMGVLHILFLSVLTHHYYPEYLTSRFCSIRKQDDFLQFLFSSQAHQLLALQSEVIMVSVLVPGTTVPPRATVASLPNGCPWRYLRERPTPILVSTWSRLLSLKTMQPLPRFEESGQSRIVICKHNITQFGLKNIV